MSLRMRRGSAAIGGGDPTPPPEQQEFGPIEGRQAIIDNAGPRPVLAPVAPFVQITTADNANFNTILTSNPGARFWVRAGTYNRTAALGQILPKSNQTIHCESGVIFEGAQMDANCMQIATTATGVTWRGGTIQNVGTTVSTNKFGVVIQGASAVVEDLEVTAVLGANGAPPYGGFGMRITGSGATIRHCWSHHNGRAGLSIGQPTIGTPGPDNLTVTRCELNNNNTQAANPAGEAGTAKAADDFGGGLNNYQFTKNYVHNDDGFGFWTDGIQPATTGVTVSENVIEDIANAGIMIELTACAVTISRNYVAGCGGGGTLAQTITNRWQILISTSNGTLGAPGGILIERNIVDAINNDHAKLIGLIQHDGHGTGATTRVKGVTVRQNQLWCRTTASGNIGGDDTAVGRPLFTEPTIDWYSNEYHVVTTATSDWRWADPQGNAIAKTFTQWQAYGFEPVDVRVVI